MRKAMRTFEETMISFYIRRYHISQVSTTSFGIIREKIFITNFYFFNLWYNTVIWILQRNLKFSQNTNIIWTNETFSTVIMGMLLHIHGSKVSKLVIFNHCCFLSLESNCEVKVVKFQ